MSLEERIIDDTMDHVAIGYVDIERRDIIVAKVECNGREYLGVAKRDPRDRFDERIGKDLALARALMSAANRLNRRASGLIRNADEAREVRELKKRGEWNPEHKTQSMRTSVPLDPALAELLGDNGSQPAHTHAKRRTTKTVKSS